MTLATVLTITNEVPVNFIYYNANVICRVIFENDYNQQIIEYTGNIGPRPNCVDLINGYSLKEWGTYNFDQFSTNRQASSGHKYNKLYIFGEGGRVRHTPHLAAITILLKY